MYDVGLDRFVVEPFGGFDFGSEMGFDTTLVGLRSDSSFVFDIAELVHCRGENGWTGFLDVIQSIAPGNAPSRPSGLFLPNSRSLSSAEPVVTNRAVSDRSRGSSHINWFPVEFSIWVFSANPIAPNLCFDDKCKKTIS